LSSQQTVAKATPPTFTPSPSASQPTVPSRAQAQPIPPPATVPSTPDVVAQRTEEKKQRASAPSQPAPMPPDVRTPAAQRADEKKQRASAPSLPAPMPPSMSEPSVQSAPRDSAPTEQPVPPPPVAQTTPTDSCGGLSGLRLEQCRACRQSDRVQRLLCEQKTRFTYCLGRGAGSLDCTPAKPESQGGGA
jgi:hypothetical protein